MEFVIFCIKRMLEAVLNPFFWLFILGMLMIWNVYSNQTNATANRLAIMLLVALSFLYAVSTPWLPGLMTSYLSKQYPKVTEVNPSMRYIVVLGGGVVLHKDASVVDQLSSSSLKRILEGVRLHQLLPEARLISSGGLSKYPTQAVGTRMDAVAKWMHVPDADRICEINSIDTEHEAIRIQSIVGQEPFYLVTSAAHMPRAMKWFRLYGLNPVAAPCDYEGIYEQDVPKNKWIELFPNIHNLYYFSISWHEYLGLIYLQLRSWITELQSMFHQ